MRPSSLTMRLTATVLVLMASWSTGYATISETEEAFKISFLTPYITDNAPTVTLSVQYDLDNKVNLGNKLPAYSVCIPPYITYDAEPNVFYAIIMIDADGPYAGAPIGAQYLNALILNIPGNDLAKADYLTPYVPPNPYVGSGYHRYVFYLFKQPEKIDIQTPYLQSLNLNLAKFSVREFAKKYGLGDCIAANFFRAQLIVCDGDEGIPQKCSL